MYAKARAHTKENPYFVPLADASQHGKHVPVCYINYLLPFIYSQQYPNAMKDHILAVTSLDYIHPDQIKSAGITACVDTINGLTLIYFHIPNPSLALFTGAGSVYIPALLGELGVNIVCALNTEPTGLFAHEPEPIPKNLTGLCEAVKKTGADIGMTIQSNIIHLTLLLFFFFSSPSRNCCRS